MTPYFSLVLTERPLFSLFSLSPKDPYFRGRVRTSPSLPYVSTPPPRSILQYSYALTFVCIVLFIFTGHCPDKHQQKYWKIKTCVFNHISHIHQMCSSIFPLDHFCTKKCMVYCFMHLNAHYFLVTVPYD